MVSQEIFGDENEDTGTPMVFWGGDDKIYGGDVGAGSQTLVGGVHDDQIWSGDQIVGDIKVYGDNKTATPLDEDAAAFNLNDGDDLIDIGNDNGNVFAFGQGGNDKIIGGFGSM